MGRIGWNLEWSHLRPPNDRYYHIMFKWTCTARSLSLSPSKIGFSVLSVCFFNTFLWEVSPFKWPHWAIIRFVFVKKIFTYSKWFECDSLKFTFVQFALCYNIVDFSIFSILRTMLNISQNVHVHCSLFMRHRESIW